jgi:hypothetical protein
MLNKRTKRAFFQEVCKDIAILSQPIIMQLFHTTCVLWTLWKIEQFWEMHYENGIIY